jgi:hypothetical protein
MIQTPREDGEAGKKATKDRNVSFQSSLPLQMWSSRGKGKVRFKPATFFCGAGILGVGKFEELQPLFTVWSVPLSALFWGAVGWGT